MKADCKLQKQQDLTVDANSKIDARNPKQAGMSRLRLVISLLLVCVVAVLGYYLIDATVNKKAPAIEGISSIKNTTAQGATTKGSEGSGNLKKMAIKDGQATDVADQDKSALNPKKLIGGDKDEHGCYLSAGYAWCQKTNQCERPWILAQKEGFENTAAAFKKYCHNDK